MTTPLPDRIAAAIDNLTAQGALLSVRPELSLATRDTIRTLFAEVVAERDAANGSLDALRNAINDHDGVDRSRQIKLPVGRVVGMLADLRAELAAATKRAEEAEYISAGRFREGEMARAEVRKLTADLAAANAQRDKLLLAVVQAIEAKPPLAAADPFHGKLYMQLAMLAGVAAKVADAIAQSGKPQEGTNGR